MPSIQFRTAERWKELILGALTARGGLTTVAPGGVLMTLAGALAQCLDELSYQASNLLNYLGLDTCTGDALVLRAQDVVGAEGITPLAAQRAQAALTFARAATAGPCLVRAGTLVKDSGGHVFATLQDATLADGVGSLPGVAAQALVPGLVGNVAAHSLSLFVSRPVGIDTVDNPAAATGGQDQEPDDSFRQRVRLVPASLARAVPAALVAAVVGQQDPVSGDTILYAAYNKLPQAGFGELYIADAAGTNQAVPTAVSGENLTAALLGPPAHTAQGGEKQLVAAHSPCDPESAYSLVSSVRGTLVAGQDYNLEFGGGTFYLAQPLVAGEQITAAYSYFTGVIAMAQAILNGGTYNGVSYPGQVAAGCFVLVRTPQLLLEQVVGQLTVADGYAVNDVQQAVTTAWTNHMASLGVGDNLLISKLVALAMGQAGVVDVKVQQPATDVLLAPSQLIRPAGVTFA